MTLETEMEKAIIRTVLRVMLPLGNDAVSSEAQEKANQIVWKLVIPAPGKTEPEFSTNVARRMLGVMLAQMGYEPPPGKEDTIRDLLSDARLDLIILTAVYLVFSYKRWNGRQYPTYLYDNPCLEFYRAFPRRAMRDWPERWKAAGGRFFPGESPYPEGRMIAMKDDPIWTTISAFGLPFPPFDFHSGMDVRDVSRQVAVELGVMQIDHSIQPAALSASNEFQERLAAKLHKNLTKLEADET
jgi:hypothetical protein